MTDAAARYEQTKTANFIASSALDGVQLSAPAWPGYPDRSKIPPDWKPIPPNWGEKTFQEMTIFGLTGEVVKESELAKLLLEYQITEVQKLDKGKWLPNLNNPVTPNHSQRWLKRLT